MYGQGLGCRKLPVVTSEVGRKHCNFGTLPPHRKINNLVFNQHRPIQEIKHKRLDSSHPILLDLLLASGRRAKSI